MSPVRLDQIPRSDLLDLFPRARIEEVVHAPVEWVVVQEHANVKAKNLAAFNTVVAADVRRRALGDNKRIVDSMVLFERFGDLPVYETNARYAYNQAVVLGKTREIVVAHLHLAVIATNLLYLHDIELANPNVRAVRPMDPDQRYAGLGNGVFTTTLDSLRAFARGHGLKQIVAFAADWTRADIFIRKGRFSLDQADPALLEAAEQTGHQVPICSEPL